MATPVNLREAYYEKIRRSELEYNRKRAAEMVYCRLVMRDFDRDMRNGVISPTLSAIDANKYLQCVDHIEQTYPNYRMVYNKNSEDYTKITISTNGKQIPDFTTDGSGSF